MKWLILISLTLASCGTIYSVKTKCNRLNSLPAKGAGQTFSITNVTQASSLQNALYESIIVKHLTAYGWRQTYDKNPDFRVNFFATKLGSIPVELETPIYRHTGGGTTHFQGNVSNYSRTLGTFSGTAQTEPTSIYVGSRTTTKIMHGRSVFCTIIDRKKQCVFQGGAGSNGFEPDVSIVFPPMIEALFNGFPGKNGENYVKIKNFN